MAVEILSHLERQLVSTGDVSAVLDAGFTVLAARHFLITIIYMTLYLFPLASTQEASRAHTALPRIGMPSCQEMRIRGSQALFSGIFIHSSVPGRMRCGIAAIQSSGKYLFLVKIFLQYVLICSI